MAQQTLLHPSGDGLYRLETATTFSAITNLPELDYQAPAPLSHSIQLLTPYGETMEFYVWKTKTGSDLLESKYPGIITFGGRAKNNPAVTIRGEWSSEHPMLSPQMEGRFGVMVFGQEESWVIRPNPASPAFYEMGTHSDYEHLRQEFVCALDDSHLDNPSQGISSSAPYTIGEQLRIYRLAVGTTDGYSNYFGNDIPDIMTAVMASVNRVNELYERDLSATFRLVEDTDKTFYIGNDPYPASGSGVLNVSHGIFVDSLGQNAFDIGHVFDTGGGGIAAYRSLCSSNQKGRGYTSLSPPEGDPFDIDYLAHELGHQFGGSHSWNSCPPQAAQRSGSTAFEPGSGVTIMAYAGICGAADNLANRSISQFHVGSIQEITGFTQFGGGNNCPVIMDNGNTQPIAEAIEPSNLFLPISTPFELEATATDVDGTDNITFNWENNQTGPLVALGEASGTSPLFRNFNLSTNPIRVFPRMEVILAGIQSDSEILPSYNRTIRFRVTARDGNGGVYWDDVTTNSILSGGPFSVSSQAEEDIDMIPGQVTIVEWNRGGTHAAPFNADSVDIYISADPVNGWPNHLGRFENNGQAFVQLPALTNDDSYRFKVKGADRLWFNVNTENFSLTNVNDPTLVMTTLQDEVSICGSGMDTLDLFLSQLGGASGEPTFSVSNIPAEVQFNITPTNLLAGQSYQLELINDATAPSGDYMATLEATVDGITTSIPFRLILESNGVSTPTSLLPADLSDRVSVAGPLSWTDGQPGERSYEIQLTTDASNDDWEIEGTSDIPSFVPTTNFAEETTYFWRVRTISDRCGESEWSAVQSFTTERLVCLIYTAEDTPQEMGGGLFISSRIVIDEDYPIRSIKITDIQGIYDDFGDLRFRLTTADAGSFNLVETSNCTTNNFNFSISDVSSINLICSQVNAGGVWASANPLSEIRNSSSQGNWRLRVFDQSTEGELSNWSIEICVPDQLVSVQDPGFAAAAIEVYPNPGQDRLYFRWSDLPYAPQLIRLVDITGREVLTYDAQLPSQAHRVELSTDKLVAGIYVYQVLTTDGRLLRGGRWVKN